MEFGKHKFLAMYLDYTSNTESPRLCHIWSALSGVSACLGRRCWYETGIGPVWPNMYVVLSGPPGGRKSSAIKYVRDLLRHTTSIRFAPDDTGGQRQGLIAAMTDMGDEEEKQEHVAALLQGLLSNSNEDGNPLIPGEAVLGKQVNGKKNGHATDFLAALGNIKFDTRDPRSMYASSGELKSFLGENNSQMLTYLIRMWDGDEYQYKLRNVDYTIQDGLLSIIGATTPSELALILPPGAMNSGFTSRIIFVYSPGRNRRIARPTLDKTREDYLKGIYANLYEKFEGAFTEAPSATIAYEEIYMRTEIIKDPRFMHYLERRHTHLQKTAMALAAARGVMTIEKEDILLADALLALTEETMPDAMGEYGLNKDSVAKQKLLEFVTGQTTPIPIAALYGLMSRDMKRVDFGNCITEFHNSKKLTVLDVPVLGQCVVGISDQMARRQRKEAATIAKFLSG